MASPGRIAAHNAARAAKVAELRRSLEAIQGLESKARVSASLSQGAEPPSGFRDLVARGLTRDEGRTLAQSYADLEHGLAGELSDGTVSDEYLDYLAHMGVAPETIAAVRSGDLPMDPASRAARARELELDPDVTWHRWDYPGRTQFDGRRRHGLVYANQNKSLASGAAQVVSKHHYPLTGPSSGIHGIDSTPPTLSGDGLLDAQRAMNHQYGFTSKDFRRTNSVLESPFGHNRQEALVALGDRLDAAAKDSAIIDDARQGTHRPYGHGRTPPSWELVETPAFVDDMKAKGTAGTLVRDEGDTSVAFAPDARLRHAGLAVFDTRFPNSRNILQSMLVPAVAAGGAVAGGQQQPSLLGGLNRR